MKTYTYFFSGTYSWRAGFDMPEHTATKSGVITTDQPITDSTSYAKLIELIRGMHKGLDVTVLNLLGTQNMTVAA